MDKKFRRQFGSGVTKTLLRCATAVADLKDLRAAGMRIRRYRGHKNAAYSMAPRKAMYISSRSTIGGVITSVAHERVHLLDSPTRAPVLGGTSREEFIEHCLDCEIDAIMHEATVVAELLHLGYRYFGQHQLELYRRVQQGRVALRQWLNTTVTSTDGTTYPEYYGRWYDDVTERQTRSLRRRAQLAAHDQRVPTEAALFPLLEEGDRQ